MQKKNQAPQQVALKSQTPHEGFGAVKQRLFLSHHLCLCVFEQKFQEIEEAHLRQMKQLIKGYSHSIEDTHVQVGQVRSSSCEILHSCISPRSFHAVFFFHRFLLELRLFKARWESRAEPQIWFRICGDSR